MRAPLQDTWPHCAGMRRPTRELALAPVAAGIVGVGPRMLLLGVHAVAIFRADGTWFGAVLGLRGYGQRFLRIGRRSGYSHD